MTDLHIASVACGCRGCGIVLKRRAERKLIDPTFRRIEHEDANHRTYSAIDYGNFQHSLFCKRGGGYVAKSTTEDITEEQCTFDRVLKIFKKCDHCGQVFA